MEVRKKDKPEITGTSDKFNTHGLGEMIVYFDEGDMSSEFIKEYEVKLGDEWVDLQQAFRDRRVIGDNYDIHFREPRTDEERKRGWYDH